MSSEQCSLGSILPPNYRHRAEAFARDLQQRLWNLGSNRGGASRSSSSSTSSEDPHGKHRQPHHLQHPGFEGSQSSSSLSSCQPSCGCVNLDEDEDSSPRSPSEIIEESHLIQKLVNRSDGLPIPHSIDGSSRDNEEEPSARCSFSSDSLQSIYSTPSENLSLTTASKFSCLHNGFTNFSSLDSCSEQEKSPLAPSCDLFSDLYDSAPTPPPFASEPRPKTKDYITDGCLNHNESSPPLETEATPQITPTEHFRSLDTKGIDPVADISKDGNESSSCNKNIRDIYTYEKLEDSFSQINLNGQAPKIEACCSFENSTISRLDHSDDKIIESTIPNACLDKNAKELDSVRSSDKLNSSEDCKSSNILDCSVDSAISVDMQIDVPEFPEEEECFRTEEDQELGHDSEQEQDQEIGEMKKTDRREIIENGGSCDRIKLRRSSSLKTWKTPPDTPGRKKMVRFADVLGLDLADVRTFLDEIPQVPKSAFFDLQDIDTEDMFSTQKSSLESTSVPLPKFLVPLFQQPGGTPDFFDRLNVRTVCLENAVVTDTTLLAVTGHIRVRNLDYDKSVFVRFSSDGWKSYADLKCLYVFNSCDGFSDQFSFVLYAHTLDIGQRLEFAVMFQAKGQQYWDNNGGINYIFQCVPAPPSNNSSAHGVGSPSINDKYTGFY